MISNSDFLYKSDLEIHISFMAMSLETKDKNMQETSQG